MENLLSEPTGGSFKKKALLGLGTLVVGTLAFFGIKKIVSSKTKSNEKDTSENNSGNSEIPVQTAPVRMRGAALPAVGHLAAFPLVVGSKGSNVRTLQQSLIRQHGPDTLPKYGADGYFGDELAQSLRRLGYGLPLQEGTYKKITEEKPLRALSAFDPGAVAFGLYHALISKSYSSASTLLKAIGNTNNYALVNERFKQYFIYGVRRTIVNAMFDVFGEEPQRENTRQIFIGLGLRFNPQTNKWSLSGISEE